jgi:hypothetical protein
MAQGIGIQSMGWEIRSGPYAGNADDRKKKREQRLRQLIAALQSGSLDAARLAFSAVVSHDDDVAHNSHVAHIGAALQSSNLPGAWRCAQDLRAAYPWAFVAPQKHLSQPPPITPQPQNAKSFTDGLTGRLFDLIA